MPSTTTQPDQRTVALSAIHVAEGFNPRDQAERAELARLVASIKTHGVIHPLVVCPADDNGAWRLIDGERRYRACAEAALVEVPVIVRPADAESEALDVALAANMERVDLTALEQAKAFQRLLDSGLTRRGVAERVGVSHKLVRDRLQILELPVELHAHVGDGTIAPGAIKALAELTKIDPGLAVVAVRRVLEQPADPDGWHDPLTWSDLAGDPVGFVSGGYVDDGLELPDGVFEANTTYPIGRFSLDQKATAKLAQYCELMGVEDPARVTVSFRHDDVDAAEKLGAVHRSNGYAVLIAGRAVADQLAADQIARTLKQEKARRKQAADAAGGDSAAGQGAAAPRGGGEVPDEEAVKAQRRREREADQQARRKAVAFNDELGAAVVKHVARIKVDARVVKILAAVDFGGQLGKIAMRGARYGFPGFESSEQLKSGKTKRAYLQAGPAHDQASAFIDNAGKNPGDIAGRLVSLAVMARYADEHAVAQSARSFSQLDGGTALPWSDDTVLALDEIAAEHLPEHLLEPGREQRQAQADRRREAIADREWLAEQAGALDAMDGEGRANVLAEAKQRLGDYSTGVWQLRDRIAELDANDQPAEPAEPAEVDAGSEGGDS